MTAQEEIIVVPSEDEEEIDQRKKKLPPRRCYTVAEFRDVLNGHCPDHAKRRMAAICKKGNEEKILMYDDRTKHFLKGKSFMRILTGDYTISKNTPQNMIDVETINAYLALCTFSYPTEVQSVNTEFLRDSWTDTAKKDLSMSLLQKELVAPDILIPARATGIRTAISPSTEWFLMRWNRAEESLIIYDHMIRETKEYTKACSLLNNMIEEANPQTHGISRFRIREISIVVPYQLPKGSGVDNSVYLCQTAKRLHQGLLNPNSYIQTALTIRRVMFWELRHETIQPE